MSPCGSEERCALKPCIVSCTYKAAAIALTHGTRYITSTQPCLAGKQGHMKCPSQCCGFAVHLHLQPSQGVVC
jgi:hypothetical protein